MPLVEIVVVPAETVLAAVQAYADRVHDLVRRRGCTPAEAAEVVEATALDLVELAATRPAELPDPVGWLFRRADVVARTIVGDAPAPVTPRATGETRPFVGGSGQSAITRALADVPEEQRQVLLLRDSYDLALPTVAVAVGRSAEVAATLLARGRAILLEGFDGSAADLPAHAGDPGSLARLADGGSRTPRDTVAARHLRSCAACAAAVEAQTAARRVLAGLVVVALDDQDRDALLRRTRQAVADLLPTKADLAAQRAAALAEEPVEPERWFPVLLIVVLLGVALIAGVAVGIATL